MKVTDYFSGNKIGSYTGESKVTAKDDKTQTQTQTGQTTEQGSGDKVRLSDRSREIARAREGVDAAPEVRSEKVEEIKARLAAGTYDVNAEMIAEKMLMGSVDETV